MRNPSRGLRCGYAVKSGSLAFTLVAALWAQNSPPPQPVVVPNAERRMLKSAINGTEYQIDVALPRGYSASGGKRYPVVYTLDGIAYFALITDTVRLLQVLRDDLIVVGIGYPAKTYPFWDDAFGAHRALDYSTKPTKPSPALRPGEFPMGPTTEFGGAPAFLRFLREELIP